ncbi:hypothetical protein GUITHDRAFT_156737, partial [Guillardia theta CCMP2712]
MARQLNDGEASSLSVSAASGKLAEVKITVDEDGKATVKLSLLKESPAKRPDPNSSAQKPKAKEVSMFERTRSMLVETMRREEGSKQAVNTRKLFEHIKAFFVQAEPTIEEKIAQMIKAGLEREHDDGSAKEDQDGGQSAALDEKVAVELCLECQQISKLLRDALGMLLLQSEPFGDKPILPVLDMLVKVYEWEKNFQPSFEDPPVWSTG